MFRKIASNTLAQLIAKFFSAGLTLLTTYLLIRQAGLDLYGDMTKILVLVAVGFSLIDFGLNAEGIRSAKNDQTMLNNTLSILVARVVLSLIVIFGLNLFVFLLPTSYSRNLQSVFWLGSLAIIFQGIYTSGNAWFQHQLLYWKSTLSVFVGTFVNAALTLYFLRYSPTLFNFIFATTSGYLFMALITLFLLPPLPLSKYRFKLSVKLLSRSLVLGMILVASVVASKLDTILLGVFRSTSEVGQYGFAYRIFDVLLVIPAFVMNAVYPLYLKERNQESESRVVNLTTKYLASLSLLVALIVYFLAPYLIVIRPGLLSAVSVLRILSIALPLFYLTPPLMWALIAQKRDKLVLGIYLFAALLNFALNYLLVPSFGLVAAALNTGLTELAILLSLLIANKRFP